jgi:hypothetical protein
MCVSHVKKKMETAILQLGLPTAQGGEGVQLTITLYLCSQFQFQFDALLIWDA